VPGFETYIDFASWHNEFGYTQYARRYCDGAFCYNITYQAKHVLTVGWSAGRDGILVTQIQLREPKGNRWLYKLPRHYFDHCLERLALTFPSRPLWLVTGPSMADHVSRSYPSSSGAPDGQTLERITRFYDRGLEDFERTTTSVAYNRRQFVLLAPRRHSPVVAHGAFSVTRSG
jgi:hypothetical protein